MQGDIAASVIVPCYGADAWLPLQLEALANQDDAPPFEVIVVDNGGNQDLPGLVSAWRRGLPELRIVDATGQPGVGFARNVGVLAARAPLLLFCDCDDVVMPEWVRLGVRQLSRSSVFSGGSVSVSDDLCKLGWEAVVSFVGPHDEPAGDLAPSGEPGAPILMGGCFGITKSLMLELGGFDLSFGNQCEDNDLAHRILEAGIPLNNAPQVCIAYRHTPRADSLLRGGAIGWSLARLCARHRCWSSSPAYSGRWVLRPIRTLWERLVGRADRRWRERLGRECAVIVGRIRFALVPLPEPQLIFSGERRGRCA